MKISKKLSNGFRIANLISTIFIVAIHYNSKMYMLPTEIGQWNYLIQEYITNGIARIAVPFFAFSSGLFFFKNYCDFNSYKEKCKQRFWSLLVPYLFGGSVILFSDTLILSIVNNYNFHIKTYDFIYGVVLNPYAHQLWFVRDLLVLTVLSPAIKYLSKYNLYMYVLLVLWIVNYNIFPKIFELYIVNIETLFFFSLGCFFVRDKTLFYELFEMNNRSLIYILLVVSLVLFAVRVGYDPLYKNSEYIGFHIENIFASLCQKTAILVGIYALIMSSSEWNSKKLIYLSGFTFFVYIYHGRPLFRFVLKSGSFFIQDKYLFYYSVPVATIAVFVMALFLNCYFRKTYFLMTGGRCPKIILEGKKT